MSTVATKERKRVMFSPGIKLSVFVIASVGLWREDNERKGQGGEHSNCRPGNEGQTLQIYWTKCSCSCEKRRQGTMVDFVQGIEAIIRPFTMIFVC
mmetsp:Transcript_18711/g.28467  ORF Transcript_18711/g.28467 Transcript_18711/m.28467 type:complete len:96 (+) Transcript_18711:2172-2459(+)